MQFVGQTIQKEKTKTWQKLASLPSRGGMDACSYLPGKGGVSQIGTASPSFVERALVTAAETPIDLGSFHCKSIVFFSACKSQGDQLFFLLQMQHHSHGLIKGVHPCGQLPPPPSWPQTVDISLCSANWASPNTCLFFHLKNLKGQAPTDLCVHPTTG